MRTRRSLLNYATGTVNSVVVLLLGFVATPFILRWLGEEQFGAFRAASDWLGYLSLLELGVGGALLALMAKALGHGDSEAARRVLIAGIRWYLWVGLLMMLGVVCLAVVIPSLVPVSAENAADLRRGVLFGLLTLTLVPLGSPFKALAEARQAAYWVNMLLMTQAICIIGFSLLLARLGWGITGQFVALAIGAAAFNLPLIVNGIGRYPGILKAVLRDPIDPEAHRGLRTLNKPTLLYNLAGRFSFQTDNIIVALWLGPTAVVPLFLTQKLILMAQGQLTSVGNASWAALAELHFQDQRELFNRRLIELTGLVSVLGLASLVPFAAYNPYFVSNWVGSEHYGGDWVSIVVATNSLVLAIISLWGWCFGGTARTPLLVRASIAETVINVSFSIFFTWMFGIVGPLLGTLVGLLSVSAWYHPMLLRRVFHTPLDKLFLAILRPLVLAVPYMGLVWWTSRAYPPVGWIQLGLHIGGAMFMYLTFWWLILLDRNGRKNLAGQASKILGR